MDPDANLNELRTLLDNLLMWADSAPLGDALGLDVERAASLFQALDEWLGKGGLLPKEWDHKPDRSDIYRDGVKAGIEAYAWWKDGEQQVGTTGTTLKNALKRVDEGGYPLT